MPGDLLRISDLALDTPVKIDYADGSITISVNDILKWVAPNAPPHEAMRLLVMCRLCGLDPFRKEIHLIPFENKKKGITEWMLVIDKSGWLRMAESNPQFDGHQSGIIIRDPETKEIVDIEGEYVPPGWGVVGGWAKVYRKDRKFPAVSRVGKEYVKGNNPMWETQMPMMYRKTGLVHSLREAGLCFGFGGLSDKSEVETATEIPDVDVIDVAMSDRVIADYQSTPMPSLSPNIAKAIEAAIEVVGMDDYRRQVMLSKRGVSHLAELSDSQGLEILSKLNEKIDQMNVGQIMLPDKIEVEVFEEPTVIADDEYIDEGGEVRKKEVVEIEEDNPDFWMTPCLQCGDPIGKKYVRTLIEDRLVYFHASCYEEATSEKENLVQLQQEAEEDFDFERAAELRDKVKKIEVSESVMDDDSGRHKEVDEMIQASNSLGLEVPEQVMDEIDSEEFDPITRREDESDIVTNFGIESPDDDSDISDIVRPESAPKKPRNRKAAK
jgi:phage recombination protein Bet